MPVLVTLLAVVLGLVVLLVAGLLRSHAEILRSLHDLGVDLDPADSDAFRNRRAASPVGPGLRRATEARDRSRGSHAVRRRGEHRGCARCAT